MIYAVITGASRGIGRELSKIFYKKNYALILTCKNNISMLYDLKKELYFTDKNNNHKPVFCKKGNLNKEYLDGILSKYDQIYILINNAGIADYNLLQDLSLDRWNEIIASNLTTVFENTKAVLENMLHNKMGIILNVSSIWGILGASGEVAYSTTKGGVNSFTKALQKELSDSNIDVIATCLGMVDTDMNKHLQEEEMETVISNLDCKRMWTAKEAAEKISEIIFYKKYKMGEIIELNNGLK